MEKKCHATNRRQPNTTTNESNLSTFLLDSKFILSLREMEAERWIRSRQMQNGYRKKWSQKNTLRMVYVLPRASTQTTKSIGDAVAQSIAVERAVSASAGDWLITCEYTAATACIQAAYRNSLCFAHCARIDRLHGTLKWNSKSEYLPAINNGCSCSSSECACARNCTRLSYRSQPTSQRTKRTHERNREWRDC